MAAVREDVRPGDAIVLPFPAREVHARARRARMRARRLGAAAVAATLIAAAGLLAAALPGGGVASRPGAPTEVVLGERDSLWALADRYAAAGADPRAYVASLLELNGGRAALAPGARVRLPGSAEQ